MISEYSDLLHVSLTLTEYIANIVMLLYSLDFTNLYSYL